MTTFSKVFAVIILFVSLLAVILFAFCTLQSFGNFRNDWVSTALNAGGFALSALMALAAFTVYLVADSPTLYPNGQAIAVYEIKPAAPMQVGYCSGCGAQVTAVHVCNPAIAPDALRIDLKDHVSR